MTHNGENGVVNNRSLNEVNLLGILPQNGSKATSHASRRAMCFEIASGVTEYLEKTGGTAFNGIEAHL